MRAGVVRLKNLVTGPLFDDIKNLRIGKVAVQVVLATTGLGAARFDKGTQSLFENVLLTGLGGQSSNSGKGLGHARTPELG